MNAVAFASGTTGQATPMRRLLDEVGEMDWTNAGPS